MWRAWLTFWMVKIVFEKNYFYLECAKIVSNKTAERQHKNNKKCQICFGKILNTSDVFPFKLLLWLLEDVRWFFCKKILKDALEANTSSSKMFFCKLFYLQIGKCNLGVDFKLLEMFSLKLFFFLKSDKKVIDAKVLNLLKSKTLFGFFTF